MDMFVAKKNHITCTTKLMQTRLRIDDVSFLNVGVVLANFFFNNAQTLMNYGNITQFFFSNIVSSRFRRNRQVLVVIGEDE